MGLCVFLAQVSQPELNLSTFDPASPSATWIRSLALFVLAVAALIFLVVEGVLIYSLVRFRKQPATPGTEPPQVYGSIPIEIAWTVGPALIVFLLVLVVIRTEYEVRPSPGPLPEQWQPLHVTVVGHQWWWEYRYTGYSGESLDVVTANELHLPQSEPGDPRAVVKRPVYLRLESVDVAHSWWVPRLAGKTDLIPGRVNDLWFLTEKTGLYHGQCAEFCGAQHANMLLRVEVESPELFRRWLDNERQPEAGTARDQPGRKVFLAQACVNCHRIRGATPDDILGTRTKDGTLFGPDLTHLASRQTLASGILPNTRENLIKWIANPQAIKPGCRMPAMGLSADDIEKIADYLGALQ
jgi:cytochrome c oxidase subunit 2